MKKVALILIIIIIALFMIGGRPLPAGEKDVTNNNWYARSMIVTDIIDNEIICVDSENEEWSFYTEYKYNVGATIICIMNTMGTDSIYDDVITLVSHNNTFIKS